MKTIFACFLLLLTPQLFAQEVPLLWEQEVVLSTPKVQSFEYQFEIDEPGENYLLEIENPGSHALVSKVQLNNNNFPIIPLNGILQKVNLLSENKIKIQLFGKPQTKIKLRIFSFGRLVHLMAPKQLRAANRPEEFIESVPAPGAGVYLLKVKADLLSMLASAIGTFRLNGKDLISITDLVSVRNNELFKLVQLNDLNELSIRLFAKRSVEITIFKLPPSLRNLKTRQAF